MRLFELFEAQSDKKIFVVYGGGFQPFHRGHLSSYYESKAEFADADYYVAASNDTKVRPIPFVEKKFLAQQAGVTDPFVEVKTPINPREIMQKYNPEQDIFVLVRSERDPMSYTKKDGSPGYFQPFVSIDNCEPFGRHGYVFVTKKKTFDLIGQEVFSGSQVREMYAAADDDTKLHMISDLYPAATDSGFIKELLDRYF